MKALITAAIVATISTTAYSDDIHGSTLTMTNDEYKVTSDLGYLPLEEVDMGLFYDADTHTLTLAGQINHLEWAKFQMLGWDEEPIERFVIRSGGGMTRIGWAFAEFVRKNNVIVEVANQCDSACTLIALSAPKIEGHGTLGFHLPYLVPQAGADTTDVGYQMAMAGIEGDINDAINFFENSKYIDDALLERIKTETSADILIDIDVREFTNK